MRGQGKPQFAFPNRYQRRSLKRPQSCRYAVPGGGKLIAFVVDDRQDGNTGLLICTLHDGRERLVAVDRLTRAARTEDRPSTSEVKPFPDGADDDSEVQLNDYGQVPTPL